MVNMKIIDMIFLNINVASSQMNYLYSYHDSYYLNCIAIIFIFILFTTNSSIY